MRRCFRIIIPRYGASTRTDEYEYVVPRIGQVEYIIHANSMKEAISKLPAAEDHRLIEKIDAMGYIYYID